MRVLTLLVVFILNNAFSYEFKQLKILNTIPHEASNVFTQGLFVHNDKIYETTGLVGSSSINVYELPSGKVYQQVLTKPQFFGEGSATHNDKLYQLTWTDGVVLTYKIETLELVSQDLVPPTNEAWGLATGENGFWFTNGSNTLYLLDFDTFKTKESHSIMVDNKPLINLNEIEEIDGLVYMNVWFQDYIYVYDPKKREIVYKIVTTDVISNERKQIFANPNNVINGIAYDSKTKRLFITGKNWKNIYQVEVVSQNALTNDKSVDKKSSPTPITQTIPLEKKDAI